jgi:hypothetical protein
MALLAALVLGGAGAAWAAVPCEESLEACIDTLHTCRNDLWLRGRELGDCVAEADDVQRDLEGCETDLYLAQADLKVCTHSLEACRASAFPASGQTTAFPADNNDGIAGEVAVPDDGTVQAGADLSFQDNGDGTITDIRTGLMWEKKSDDGGLHDKDNFYWWSGNGDQETVWDWLADVNAEGGSGFAGHDDWRVPNVKELLSIVNYQNTPLAVSPAFDNNCGPGATVITGSCTFLSVYWSSTTWAVSTGSAFGVNFNLGEAFPFSKPNTNRVRAVRGGSQ